MKNFIAMTAFAVSTLLFSACGTSKVNAQSPVNSAIGQKVELDPVMEYAEQNPAIRDFGIGQHFKEATAKNIAAAQARGAYASAIRSAIIAACEESNIDLTQYAGDDESGKVAIDQSSMGGDLVRSIAAEIVNNTHPVKSSKFILPNKQWKYYVCIEYMENAEQLAKDIEKKLEEKISPEDRVKLEERHEKFRQSILNNLNQGE
ncbi:MAG: hypothetical protein J6B92_06705 [Paraprevotella sp.]|nr:hypothetical protein [Paraprevotella sp.]